MRLNRSQVRISAVPLLGNNLRQVVHTRVHLSPSSIKGTGQGVVMHCGWGGNRRSGIALAMRRLQWFIHLRARTLRKGDEHPAYTPMALLFRTRNKKVVKITKDKKIILLRKK